MFGKNKKQENIEELKTDSIASKEIDEKNKTPEILEHHSQVNKEANTASIIVETDSYYQKAYFRMSWIALTTAFALILSVGLNIFQVKTKPEPRYFASTTDLRLAQLTPLNQPQMSQAALLNWAVEAVSETLSLDFRNFQKQLTSVRDRYTATAYKDLINSMKSSGNLRMIVDKRLSATCIATSAPIIEKAGLLNGVYTWRITFPMVITYEDSNGIQNKQGLKTVLTIERVPTTHTPKGILIKQIITKPTK